MRSRYRINRLGAMAAASGIAMAAVTLGAPSANAQSYPPAVENNCRDDYFKFCTPYALGSKELRRCMESKGSNLSVKCRQALRDAGLVRNRNRRGS